MFCYEKLLSNELWRIFINILFRTVLKNKIYIINFYGITPMISENFEVLYLNNYFQWKVFISFLNNFSRSIFLFKIFEIWRSQFFSDRDPRPPSISGLTRFFDPFHMIFGLKLPNLRLPKVRLFEEIPCLNILVQFAFFSLRHILEKRPLGDPL